ncbi:hypothetical protein ACH4TV_44855 [Streptomyces sp. NPDC020898]|uniref:hypothetical protein n=1 Tax=Streptomyces sp. NPDC020898 TaxID=3365101 RepID=UPI0037984555
MTIITRTATAAAICAAVLLTGTACTSDGGDAPETSAQKSATPSVTAEPAAVESLDGETVTEAPKIERRTIASFANGQLGRAIPLKGGLHKGTLGIALNCKGKGTVKVEVPAVGVTFSQPCTDVKVTSIYNEVKVRTVYPDAYVQVTGTSGVRWSVSAGQ